MSASATPSARAMPESARPTVAMNGRPAPIWASWSPQDRSRRGAQPGWSRTLRRPARFGDLKPGTGLLLDMGRPVTITGAQVTLGGIPGADLELRVGAAPALADLRPVADATNAYRVVRLDLTRSARGRYVVIWFTRLPADSSGTFQATISDVTLW